MIFILSLFIYRALLTRLMYIRIQMVPKMVGWGSKLHPLFRLHAWGNEEETHFLIMANNGRVSRSFVLLLVLLILLVLLLLLLLLVLLVLLGRRLVLIVVVTLLCVL